MAGGRVRARKRFGQHFLAAPDVVDRIVAAVAPGAGQHIVEIGPGHGVLTEPLFAALPELIVIELDRDLVPLLQARFAGLNVIQGDVLSLDFATLGLPSGYRVVGNLPYNISTPLIFKLLDEPVSDMHFMLQREVVERMAGRPGTRAWGRLSIMVQVRCVVEPLFDVAPDAFEPPPKVWSQVVRLTPRDDVPNVDLTVLDDVVRTAFSNRRKTLGNALKLLDVDYNAVQVDPTLRPDAVALDEYVRIARSVAVRRR